MKIYRTWFFNVISILFFTGKLIRAVGIEIAFYHKTVFLITYGFSGIIALRGNFALGKFLELQYSIAGIELGGISATEMTGTVSSCEGFLWLWNEGVKVTWVSTVLALKHIEL